MYKPTEEQLKKDLESIFISLGKTADKDDLFEKLCIAISALVCEFKGEAYKRMDQYIREQLKPFEEQFDKYLASQADDLLIKT